MSKNEIIKNQLSDEINKYNHSVSSFVRFAEVDSFGVAHNIQYLFWLEWARIEYLKNLGLYLNPSTFHTEFPYMIVHNEIDYFKSLGFNEQYNILTRIKFIKKSSFCFENIVHNNNNVINAKAISIVVHLDVSTKKSRQIPQFYIDKIINFEKPNSILFL